MVINGILFRTRAGCPWRDVPGEYGCWKTVYNRHRSWSLDGTWQEILGRLRAGCDEAEGKDRTLSADSTVIRAHQHAAGARHALPAELVTGGSTECKNLVARAVREALGRSRGGLSTKIHLAADRPTDVMPLARWAKAAMTLQAAGSLVILGLVIARAVNILR